MCCQREDVGLIHAPQSPELMIRFLSVFQFQPILRESVSDAAKFLWWQPIMRKRFRFGAKNLREIDDRMAGDCESEFCLALTRVVDADFEKRARIKNRG